MKWKRKRVRKISKESKALLVGDNPFHNVSHLSQERTRLRERNLVLPEHAASLITEAVDNGANGFMFSISDTTLSILKVLREKGEIGRLSLFAIVPYAYEYVKLSTQVGGIPGLSKKVAARIAFSGNIKAIAMGLIGFLRTDPLPLMKTYLTFEISRIRSSAGKMAKLQSVLLHEVITDLALAMNMDWLFKAHIDYMLRLGIEPGFNTCNFAFLTRRFKEWGIDSSRLSIASPFNKVGFQMSPSRQECEEALESLSEPALIAISILAAGYLKPSEAIDYIAALPNIKGAAAGISKTIHAQETFKLLKERLDR
jgi:hypothetical protein